MTGKTPNQLLVERNAWRSLALLCLAELGILRRYAGEVPGELPAKIRERQGAYCHSLESMGVNVLDETHGLVRELEERPPGDLS